MNKIKPRPGRFVVCIDRTEDDVNLVVGKLYAVAKPEKSDPPSLLRVIDDSGEDYLYAAGWFVPVELPASAKRKLAAVSP